MRIIEATRQDAREILELQRLAFRSEAHIYGEAAVPALTQTLAALEADFARFTFLKAVAFSGRIVGSVRARQLESTCYVAKLVVHPDRQGQGIGSALMDAIEARFAGVERFELFTGHRSVRNLRLYERLGYLPCRTERASDVMELVFLEKRVAQAGGTASM